MSTPLTKVFKFRQYDVTMAWWRDHWVVPLSFLGMCLGYGRDGRNLVSQMRRSTWRDEFPDETVDPKQPCLFRESGEGLAKFRKSVLAYKDTEETAFDDRDSREEGFADVKSTSANQKVRHLVLLTIHGLRRLAGKRLNRDMDKKEFLDWIVKVQLTLEPQEKTDTKVAEEKPSSAGSKLPLSRELAVRVLEAELSNPDHLPQILKRLRVERLRAATDSGWDGIDFDFLAEQKAGAATGAVVNAPPPAASAPFPLALPPGTITGASTGRPSGIPVGYMCSREIAELVGMEVQRFSSLVLKPLLKDVRKTCDFEPNAAVVRTSKRRSWQFIHLIDGAKYYTSMGQESVPPMSPNLADNPFSIVSLMEHSGGEANGTVYWRPDISSKLTVKAHHVISTPPPPKKKRVRKQKT